jgi:hypothetical protein
LYPSQYTIEQLRELWLAQGGDDSIISTPNAGQQRAGDVAAAIGYQESRGIPTAQNVNTGGDAPGSVDYGLWQINNHYWPQFDFTQMFNPNYNANAAVQIYATQGGSFNPAWAGDIGRYEQFLPGGAGYAAGGGQQSPVQGSTNTGSVGGGSVSADVVQSTNNALQLFQNWVTNPGQNVIYKTFVLIGILILLGTAEPTSKFAAWASLAILVVLMLQTNPTTT